MRQQHQVTWYTVLRIFAHLDVKADVETHWVAHTSDVVHGELQLVGARHEVVSELVGHQALEVLVGLGAGGLQRHAVAVHTHRHEGVVGGDVCVQDVVRRIVLHEVESGGEGEISSGGSAGGDWRSDPVGVLGEGLPVAGGLVGVGGGRLLALVRGRPVEVFSSNTEELSGGNWGIYSFRIYSRDERQGKQNRRW